ncbi:hypothetical protein T07_5856 [Trichinella nelsoni]|uniref:Uncharacterized protein n=1 Tax=Trichinella nelsoni TaxID=6336 RepID=A0A0V0SNY9_9BILA|nr:hypothetical protein T07_5856 [Trichinella nelsoni]
MHRKQVGRKKLPFSKMGRSPEKFENHWLIALNGWFIALIPFIRYTLQKHVIYFEIRFQNDS